REQRIKDFIAKNAAIAEARGNRQKDVDFHNLVSQGKIVVAPNAESIGLDSSEASGVAIYDMGNGQMAIFTEQMNMEDAGSVLAQAAAQHESGHALQDSSREGRADIFNFLLSPEQRKTANAQIKALAKSGNTIAQRAVDDARAAAEQTAEDGTTTYDDIVEELEVVPYLATAVE